MDKTEGYISVSRFPVVCDTGKLISPISDWTGVGFLLLLLLATGSLCAGQPPTDLRTFIIVFDGLRPDYITQETMPNVYALKKGGSYGADNHSVFPTVTRVNAASYATGAYPAKHGLLGNSVYFPGVDSMRALNTGEVRDLWRIAEKTGNDLLTTISLGQVLKGAGKDFMVFSSGSSGQAYLQNHTVSGGIVHPEFILPARLKDEVIRVIGPAPPNSKPNVAQHEWATRAFLHYALAADGPAVSALWLSDPDGTAHSEGIGAPLAMESIRMVDEQLGKIMQSLKEKDLLTRVNIVITTDHGFVTDNGTQRLGEFLIDRNLTSGADSDDVVLAGNAIYVSGGDRVLIKKIVAELQGQPWVGAIFTDAAPGQSTLGWVNGTLSFNTIHWDHKIRKADILVDYNWDDTQNKYGYAGGSFAPGTAGHGGASPYEIHIPLIAFGPGFKKKYESSVPTSNIDIVPTILHLHGLDIPPQMDGRVLAELLVDSPDVKPSPKKEVFETSARLDWGTYYLTVERSVVGTQHYVNFAKVRRTKTGER